MKKPKLHKSFNGSNKHGDKWLSMDEYVKFVSFMQTNFPPHDTAGLGGKDEHVHVPFRII